MIPACDGGEDWEITLRVADDATMRLAIDEMASQFITDYVKGRDGGPPAPLPPIDGIPVRVSERLCHAIAGLMAFEVAPEGESAYDFYAWVRIAAGDGTAFEQILSFAAEMAEKAAQQTKN